MPVMSNPKHERFCQELAKGVRQGEAYLNAGYAPNAGAASRLAQSPKVVDRVSEIKHEIARRMEKALADPEAPENIASLAEMGLTLDWCARAYQDIYERALDTNQLSAANTAVANVQKIVEMAEKRKNGENTDDNGADRIKVSDALAMLREMRQIAEVGPGQAPMKDVSPDKTNKNEGEDFSEAEDALLLPDLGDFLDEE